MPEKKIKVVGIGNAIVDIIADVGEEFLLSCNIEKGSMRLVCEEESADLNSRIKVKKILSGGSVANTIAALALLKNKVAFIGKVNDDDLGNEFEKELKKIGVLYNTEKAKVTDLSTGSCIVLTTPDSQRTMNTCLGVAGMLGPEDIDEKLMEESEMVYIEGYLWDQETARDSIDKVFNIAREKNIKSAINLSDYLCVKRHLKEFKKTLNQVDLLFANEKEAMALFEIDDIDIALKRLSKIKKLTSGVTLSEKGSAIISGNDIIRVPSVSTIVLDSTGAGDMYAAGFLNGFLNGRDLYACGMMGSIIASEILTHFGARPEMPLLELLSQYSF